MTASQTLPLWRRKRLWCDEDKNWPESNPWPSVMMTAVTAATAAHGNYIFQSKQKPTILDFFLTKKLLSEISDLLRPKKTSRSRSDKPSKVSWLMIPEQKSHFRLINLSSTRNRSFFGRLKEAQKRLFLVSGFWFLPEYWLQSVLGLSLKEVSEITLVRCLNHLTLIREQR